MAEIKEKKGRIRNLKDTTANWERANPILLDGEMGIEDKGNGKYATKIGDGVTPWKSLPYHAKPMAEVEAEMAASNQALQNQIDNLEQASEKNESDIETLDKKMMKIVTPQMYGAKGDGVTDDTEAFKEALGASDAVCVPNGTYLITDTLDISYKKSLYSDDGQRATILYNGTNNVVNIGRMSVFRNINVTIKNAFEGTIFDTNNYNKNSGEPALGSIVEHVFVDFLKYSPNATLIGLTADSGTDPNNMPRLKGFCFQTYHDIHVDNSSQAYGYGIKMEIIQGRDLSSNATGYPWINHISYSDISLAHPHTAIKSVVTLPDNATFERYSDCGVGEIRLDNVYSQCFQESDKHELTRYFLDLEHISGFFTRCKAWDYHYFIANGGETDTDHIINIIGKGVKVCFGDCDMTTWDNSLLSICRFTEETEYNTKDNPAYFINKYFPGSVLIKGYDGVNAKIDAKMEGGFVGDIAEDKVYDILYNNYVNVLEDPLTQILVKKRWSGSGKEWVDSDNDTTIIIPIVAGGNIIRWSPTTYRLSDYHKFLYFIANDDLSDLANVTNVIQYKSWESLGATRDGGIIKVENPSGYKYLAIPFGGYTSISPETMVMTVNRKITESNQSYTQYIRERVVKPEIPTNTVIADIAEEKVNDILHNSCTNVLEDPLTQIKLQQRYSNSSATWENTITNTTIIIPIVEGVNVIRWTPMTYSLAEDYQSVFFFNDDSLTDGVRLVANVNSLVVSSDSDAYIQVNNPNGYKYVSVPFKGYTGISPETMVMTINRKIVNDGKSYTEYLKENVVKPTISEKAETWTFTLADGSTVTKKVVLV